MEAPPPLSTPPPTPTTPAPPPAYPDSVDSSPHSRKNDSFDADPPPLRLMCSYGGHIVPRPHDKTLCYAGGDTRIIVIDRHTSLSDLHRRLSKNLFNNQPFYLKYQLPSEDLDSLITVTSDEDLENMVEEYDRLNNAAAAGMKPGRLRLFLFPESSSSIEQLLVETASTKSEDWFFNALNGKTSTISASDRGFSESSSVNCLLGLDDEFVGKAAAAVEKDAEAQIEGPKSVVRGNVYGNYGINHDVHSVPDSPMLETTSSFGSTSSSPSVANLPPIRTHVDENPKVAALGIEEQFQQMSVGVVGSGTPPPPQKQEEVGAFMPAGAAAGTVVSGFPAVVGGDYPNRVISDDERSDHSDHRKPQQIQQVQFQPQPIPQFQQTQANAFDLPSPDSISSEGSLANAMSRQRQAIYQEPLIQIQSGNTMDQNNSKVQMQPQIQESSYVITNQYDQIQPQLHQPQQFLHPSSHYIPSNAVPITSYYSVYPSQKQNHPHQSAIDQHYPVYFMSGKQAQPYNFPVQQPSYSELAPSNIAPHTGYNQTRNVPSSKPEMAGGVYRTAPPQPQYVGFSPIHQPSPGPNSTYPYELSDPAHQQVYYTPLPPQYAAHYQTLTSAPDAPAQVLTESMKQQGRNLQQ